MDGTGAPGSWGRYPRNIAKYIKGGSAPELSATLFAPCIFKRVSATTYCALQWLVLAISLATSMELTQNEIDNIEAHLTLVLFVKW
jgi:hypothetical protein